MFFIAAIALFVPLTGLAESFGDRFGVPWPLLVVLFTAPFLMTIGALIAFALSPAAVWWATRPLGVLPDRFEERARQLIKMFLEGLVPLTKPRTLAVLVLLSVPIWLFESGLFFFVGFAFRLDQVYDNLGDLAVVAVVVTSVANIGSSVPAAPGGIGLFELVARETLVLLPMAEVARSVAGGYAAVVHAALLLPMIVLGQLFLWTSHISLRSLSRGGREARAQSGFAATRLSLEKDDSR